VQPAGDSALWSVLPFSATERDGKIWGRGVADTKGHIVSRLAAIDALRAGGGSLPVKIKWIIEGEEEIGSPSLDAFLLQYRDRLAANGCLWEYGTFALDGTPQLMLGMKGMLTVELRVEGANRDLHSAMAAFVTSPVWRLIWALDTLKDENENILIEGFDERIRPPSSADLDMIRMLPDDTQPRLEALGLTSFAAEMTGYHLRAAEVFSPTCNIHGLTAGYQGPGSKTIIPREASAKLDFRLVPDQDPDEILQLLRDHLAAKGFTDVVVTEVESSLFPARTDPSDPFVVLAMAVCAEGSGRPPLVYPSSAGSGPMYSFTKGLGVPVISLGVAYSGSAIHAPDEHIRQDDFAAGTRLVALLMERMAAVDFAAYARVSAAVWSPTAAAGRTDEEIAADRAFLENLDTGLEPIDFDAIAAEMAREFAPAETAAAPAEAPARAPRKPRRPRKKA
jgi:acetylornithine deacetylase/succinyl-diaminopimelate desuccinylase-like protein